MNCSNTEPEPTRTVDGVLSAVECSDDISELRNHTTNKHNQLLKLISFNKTLNTSHISQSHTRCDDLKLTKGHEAIHWKLNDDVSEEW